MNFSTTPESPDALLQALDTCYELSTVNRIKELSRKAKNVKGWPDSSRMYLRYGGPESLGKQFKKDFDTIRNRAQDRTTLKFPEDLPATSEQALRKKLREQEYEESKAANEMPDSFATGSQVSYSGCSNTQESLLSSRCTNFTGNSRQAPTNHSVGYSGSYEVPDGYAPALR